jgi:CBS domain-containing protein
MILKEITDFFKVSPPFDLLTPDQLDKTSKNVSVEFFPRGEKIYEQDGPPSTSLGIIRKGGVKINLYLKDGTEKVIDFRSKGESFGFLSLISGENTRSNIIAIEDTICYMIPKDIILEMVDEQPLLREFFLKSFWVHFSDKTYQEMHNRHMMLSENDRMLYLSHVGDLITRDVVTAKEDHTIKEAAEIMSDNNISSLIIVDEDHKPTGIVTLRDFRDRVLIKGIDPERPVTEIMSPPTFTVDSSEMSFEALIKMLSYNIHHLLVTENNKMKGVVTNTDFMLLQGVSPISIVKSIELQDSLDGLVPLHEKLDKIISTLINNGINAKHIVRIITNINDRFVAKIFNLNPKVNREIYKNISCISFGSSGRVEQTLKRDWNAAIVYDDPESEEDNEKFRKFSKNCLETQQGTFSKYGFSEIELEPFGKGVPIYGSLSEWEERIDRCFSSGERDVLISICKFLDMRLMHGNNEPITRLKERIHSLVRNNRSHMSRLVEIATGEKAPLGFFKDHVVKRDGELVEDLDLRKDGIHPIVDCIRVLSIHKNIDEVSTTARLYKLTNANNLLLPDLKNDIPYAFEFLLNLRIRDQIRKKELGHEINSILYPEILTPLEKRSLKEVFQIVAQLQLACENYMRNEGVIE